MSHSKDEKGRKTKVLIVDDQPGVRYLLEIVVREMGLPVWAAKNGLEAVQMTVDHRPDLIFMDVRMPLMGGLEALEKIKKVHPKAKVMIMTAYSSKETMALAQKLGAYCCLAKPFDIEDIRKILERESWLLENRYLEKSGA